MTGNGSWCNNGKHARCLFSDSKLMESILEVDVGKYRIVKSPGSGPWLVMIYLLTIRKSPQIRTYGGVAFEATVMLVATVEK